MGVAEVAMPLYPKLPESSVTGQGMSASNTSPDVKHKKKICCACPETKRLRDDCIVEHGEAACEKWIQAHIQCLRAEGFKI